MLNRRHEDKRIFKLMSDVEVLKTKMDENTEVTQNIADMLASFKLIARVAKWLAIVFTAVGIGLHIGADIKQILRNK